MTCPQIGFPGTAEGRSSGSFFQLSNNVVQGNFANNIVSVTVKNVSSVPAAACCVKFNWLSDLFSNPTNFPGGSGTNFHNPTDFQALASGESKNFAITWSTAGCNFDMGHLYAQAMIAGQNGCHPWPNDPNYTDCTPIYNAADFIAFSIGASQAIEARVASPVLFFAVGIVNADTDVVETGLDVQAIEERTPGFSSHLRVRRLKEKGGRWLKPRAVSVGLGTERVLRSVGHSPRPAVGVLSRSVFDRLRVGELDSRQKFDLAAGETRQALVQLEQSEEARPGDFYVVRVDQHRLSDPKQTKGQCSVVLECTERPNLVE